MYHGNPAQHKLSASCASTLSVEAVLCFPLCPSKVTVAWQLGQLCHAPHCSSHSPRLPKDACISVFHLLQPITPGSTRSLGQRHFSRCASNVGLCSCAGTSRTPTEGTANTFLQQTVIVVGHLSKYQHSPEKYHSPPQGSAQQGWMAQQPTFRCTAEIDPPQSFVSVYPPLSSMFCMRIDCTGYLTDVYCTSFTFGSQKAQPPLPGVHTTLAGMETPCP